MDFLLNGRQCNVWRQGPEVGNVPIVDPVRPFRITLPHHGTVFLLVEGDDKVGILEVLFLDLQGKPGGGVVVNAELLESLSDMEGDGPQVINAELGRHTAGSGMERPADGGRQGIEQDVGKSAPVVIAGA